ncbi:MAG: hypothetical protein LBH69_02025 [Methanomassiliicoccaceae archaeon]|jgi:hypothetical protein|nr:hypothetical protein [Methanomassiliicoccaceae archaeon]
MLFRKPSAIPKEVSDAAVTEWYSSLSDQDRTRLARYLNAADVSSAYSFLSSVASAALSDENYGFAASVCEECLRGACSGTETFRMTESLIEAYIGMKRYADARSLCENNLRLFPSVRDAILEANNGSLPGTIACRNRYFDIVVGVESGYDEAFALLDRFFEMGLIDAEDLAYRKQSLKIRRLQRSFDGVFTYSYKD